MARTPDEMQYPADLLAELRWLRTSATRHETAKALAKLAAGLAIVPAPLLAGVGGADQARAEAAKAIAALSAAYDRSEQVPDDLWARAVNLTHAWANAGG